ncbi:MAG TPA: AraC family transcriptional regulator [Rhodanobacter sp.]|nr:AraC family transcriptional regulator [Rhodanobacter sp.]
MDKWCGADVAAEYLAGLLQVLEWSGIASERALEGTGIQAAHREADLRLTTQQDAMLLANAVRLTGDAGLGFKLGLCSTLTWHGTLGFALMSSPTLRDALRLWQQYLCTRIASFDIRLLEQGRSVEIYIQDLARGAPMRHCAIERLATMTARLAGQLVQRMLPEVELWFPEECPDYYAAYQERLTTVHFGTGVCMIRMPINYLDLPLPETNAVALRQARQQCEQERLKYGFNECLIERTKNLLLRKDGTCLKIDEVATALYMSSRTLKRKLHQQGFQFRQLVDDVRKREVMGDLVNTTMTIDEIAGRRGYADAANLTRAFRRWMGEPPSQYRSSGRSSGANGGQACLGTDP